MIRVLASALFLTVSSVGAQTIVPPPPPPPPPAVQPTQSVEALPPLPSHPAGPASFTVSGTVVSATTGTPLDRADVTLSLTSQGGSFIAASVTTENGSFLFDRLQAGTYTLAASRRGYLPASYQEHDGFYTGVVTGPGLFTGGLRLELFPTAVIDGAVTDGSGDPVAGAQVRLFRQDQPGGTGRVVNAGMDVTDDTGAYEFARLRAGTYYISVSASPWYAFHPPPKTDDNGNLLAPDQQVQSPLDVAYPTTWYEDATDSDSASPISVSAGDHVEADLSLRAVPAIRIRIRLQVPGDSRGVSMPQLVQEVFGADQYMPADEITVATKGGGLVGELSGIAPGHYLLRQFSPQGEGSRSANVDLSSDQTVDFSAASAGGVDVFGKVAMAAGGKLPNRTRLSLVPDDGSPAIEGGPVGADGTFSFHSVAPGRYAVDVGSPGSQLAVMQMLASGAESQGDHIVVASEPVLLAATLADGLTTINGYARLNGRGVGGVIVLLIPRDPHASRQLERRDQSNTDGSFTLSRVVPGNYTLVAIENGWTLDWSRPEDLAPYLARGLPVRIRNEKTLNLPAGVEVQPR